MNIDIWKEIDVHKISFFSLEQFLLLFPFCFYCDEWKVTTKKVGSIKDDIKWVIRLGNFRKYIDNGRKDKLGESDTRQDFLEGTKRLKEITTPNSKFLGGDTKLPLKWPLFNSWAVWSNIEPYGYSYPGR